MTTLAIDVPKEYENACYQAGDLLFIPAGLLTSLDVGEPVGRIVRVYDCDWTIVQQDKRNNGWLAKQGRITSNTFITQDRFAQDGHIFQFNVSLFVGSWRSWPLDITLGRKLQQVSLLRIGRINGWRKPAALLGFMRWHGNGKRMWSIDLCFIGYEWVNGRGVHAHYLR